MLIDMDIDLDMLLGIYLDIDMDTDAGHGFTCTKKYRFTSLEINHSTYVIDYS
jgi:hypothetical protein